MTATIIVGAVVLAALCGALYGTVKRFKNGGCGCGCEHCRKNCSSRVSTKDK
ncbi:MAG: FeoB-associated Cys-rich membrane protein [Abditibacteriota bacterium]|nr:FeoB-associated Cys-rich membrane protein [Abditibacteriota bacterium]